MASAGALISLTSPLFIKLCGVSLCTKDGDFLLATQHLKIKSEHADNSFHHFLLLPAILVVWFCVCVCVRLLFCGVFLSPSNSLFSFSGIAPPFSLFSLHPSSPSSSLFLSCHALLYLCLHFTSASILVSSFCP